MDIFVTIFFSPLCLVVYIILFVLFSFGRSNDNASEQVKIREISGIFLWASFGLIGVMSYSHYIGQNRLKSFMEDCWYLLFPITSFLSLWGIKRAKQSLSLIENGERSKQKIGFNPNFRLVVFWILFGLSIVGLVLSAFSSVV